ncbi:unnamed protein product [Lymnaea stagnalis]|uniref:C2H2-type domain-containing protein n=1 Tax=Lymnaea stagnalis TaxID=6523 RepID=A0AAV2I131_LYMST
MAEEEQVQYHIEIQDASGFDAMDGEVMVVLDLNGQDLPASVAQTIMELAQNSRHNLTTVMNDHADVKFITQDAQQIAEFSSENSIEQVKLEDIDMFDQSKEGAHNLLQDIDLEKVNVIDSETQETKTRYLVHNLAELERTKVGTTYKPRKSTSKGAGGKKVERLPPLINEITPKVEVGVQCELINIKEKNADEEEDGKVINDCAAPDHIGESCKGDEYIKSIKTEPLWAEDSRQGTNQPAVPEEAAVVPQEKTCLQCSYTCDDDLDLGRHMRKVHKEKKPYTCSVCNTSFEIELSLQIHALMHSGAKRPASKWKKKKKLNYVCPLCSMLFSTVKKLCSHAESEHKLPTIHTCDTCKFACLSKSELSEHNITLDHVKRASKISVCPVCNVATLKMTAHLAKMHPEHRPHICHICSFKSKSVTGLKYHIQTHVETKNFICPKCGRACKSKIVLKRHIKNHDPVKKFQCSLCPFGTNESYEHKRHVRRVHSKKTYYSCKHCDLSFLQVCDLKLHAMSEHQSRDSYFCNYCEFSCETRIELKTHVQTHTGKHRFLCETCDFTTPFRAHLERHRNTHTDIRPYKCPICGYECRENINLKKHMVTHSDEKPFSCSLCPYTCKLKNLLDSHIRIVHTSLKPYSCNACPYRAKTSGNLKKHMWIHQQYKPYQCRFCTYTAREKNKLARHEKTKHKDGVEEDFQKAGEESNSQTIEDFSEHVIYTVKT